MPIGTRRRTGSTPGDLSSWPLGSRCQPEINGAIFLPGTNWTGAGPVERTLKLLSPIPEFLVRNLMIRRTDLVEQSEPPKTDPQLALGVENRPGLRRERAWSRSSPSRARADVSGARDSLEPTPGSRKIIPSWMYVHTYLRFGLVSGSPNRMGLKTHSAEDRLCGLRR
jgi:hypothetical protein